MNKVSVPPPNDKRSNDRRPYSHAGSLDFCRFSTSSGSMRKYAMAEKTVLAAPKPIAKRRLLLVVDWSVDPGRVTVMLKKTLARRPRMLRVIRKGLGNG